jgi:hypothetical protein
MPPPPRGFGDSVTSRSEPNTAFAYARTLSRVWVIGDATETPIPADPDALRDGGTRFLTDAFRRFGSLGGDNEVTAVTAWAEFAGGSTGRKLALSVTYRRPGPHRDLFAKFSRDLDDPERDAGRTQMESEVAFAAATRCDGFPVTVPTVLFADYHRYSGTGILLTERIPFGHDGIEPQYAKCMDYDMPDQVGHYRALLASVARLAGADCRGALEFDVGASVPTVGPRPHLDRAKLLRRVDRLSDFAAAHPGLLPESVRSAPFLTGLRDTLPELLRRESDVWELLAGEADLTALCHWNANVDNAWFWRDDHDGLQCGLMDWGCVGRMNVAMAIWGAMCSAETDLWDGHLRELLTGFACEFHRHGGAKVDVDVLVRHVLLYASVMGMTWLLDVPSYIRSTVRDLDAHSTRFDPAIRDVESARCRLQMMTNVLNLWATHGVDGILPT